MFGVLGSSWDFYLQRAINKSEHKASGEQLTKTRMSMLYFASKILTEPDKIIKEKYFSVPMKDCVEYLQCFRLETVSIVYSSYAIKTEKQCKPEGRKQCGETV